MTDRTTEFERLTREIYESRARNTVLTRDEYFKLRGLLETGVEPWTDALALTRANIWLSRGYEGMSKGFIYWPEYQIKQIDTSDEMGEVVVTEWQRARRDGKMYEEIESEAV